MSVPAPALTPPVGFPQPRPQPDPRGERPEPPAARRPASSPPQSRQAARRGHHSAFWLFAAAVVALMVMGLVAVNALLVNTTYGMQAVRRQVTDLSTAREDLRTEVARLSSPYRVAEWAAARGMVMPDPGDSVILTVAGTGGHEGGNGGV